MDFLQESDGIADVYSRDKHAMLEQTWLLFPRLHRYPL